MITSRRVWPKLTVGALLLVTALGANADEALTERNKAIVRDFYTAVFIKRNVDAAPRFLSPGYVQHNAHIPTGLKGFMDTFRPVFAQKPLPDYRRELLNVVGENDMVVIYVRQSGTDADGSHHLSSAFDMFRVQNGLITEHWD
jgi:predicted SnoaL-like aldol condensation-catalyzing enzyme